MAARKSQRGGHGMPYGGNGMQYGSYGMPYGAFEVPFGGFRPPKTGGPPRGRSRSRSRERKPPCKNPGCKHAAKVCCADGMCSDHCQKADCGAKEVDAAFALAKEAEQKAHALAKAKRAEAGSAVPERPAAAAPAAAAPAALSAHDKKLAALNLEMETLKISTEIEKLNLDLGPLNKIHNEMLAWMDGKAMEDLDILFRKQEIDANSALQTKKMEIKYMTVKLESLNDQMRKIQTQP